MTRTAIQETNMLRKRAMRDTNEDRKRKEYDAIMKVLFMGTPDFAAGALEALIRAGHEVTAVVTQPDRPKGRGKEMQSPPVKECAVRHGIPVLQPVKIREKESVDALRRYEADIYVVAAFGQILTREILDIPRFGCINIHASLLPKYRGAAPIQWSILDGEKETGVTIQQMNEGIDTGDILSSVTVPIAPDETGDSLFDKLMRTGAELLVETLPRIESGEITPLKQDESHATYAKRLTKEIGNIDWREPAQVIERKIRGLNSWPSAYTMLRDKPIKIWSARLTGEPAREADQSAAEPVREADQSAAEPVCGGGEVAGRVTKITREEIYVNCGDEQLALREVQPAGKKRMTVKDFLLGYRMQPGEKFG